MRRLFYDNADPESEEAALDMGEIVESEAVETLEVVDIAGLRTYAAKQVDRRQDMLVAYISRLEQEGQAQGKYVPLRIKYYRKHGLPGRLYAMGPSLQNQTKEARAAAMDGFTYALDACNCFPSLPSPKDT